jgi:hypothetical protein
MTKNYKEINQRMLHITNNSYYDHFVRDRITGDIDATRLAEYTCNDLDDYDGDDIPEIYYEVAGWMAVAEDEDTMFVVCPNGT